MPDDQNPELPLTPPPPGDGGIPGALNIQPVNIEDEMKRSYLDYSMSVIIGRALPDVRDGLKPVHRRILYAMQEMGLLPNRKHAQVRQNRRRSAWASIIRTATSRCTTRWCAWRSRLRMRYPLVDGQGNFGSVDGDPPAAYRYTEARLTRVADALCWKISTRRRSTFVPTYDGNEIEPDVLPTRIPNLLVNGSNGIAVGMATNIPPHNLTEIVDATITLVNNPAHAACRDSEDSCKGPDFPTAGIIHGKSGIFEAYKHRPRPLHDARQGRHRDFQQRSRGDRRHRDSLPGQQGAPDRAHRRSW